MSLDASTVAALIMGAAVALAAALAFPDACALAAHDGRGLTW
jgi:hypothetical protein